MWRTAVMIISQHTRICETLIYESIVSGSEHFRKKLKENLVSGRPVLLSENFKALDLVYLFKNMITWLTTVICMGKDF